MKTLIIALLFFLLPLFVKAQETNGWHVADSSGQVTSLTMRLSDTAYHGTKSQYFRFSGKHNSSITIEKTFPSTIYKKQGIAIFKKVTFLEPLGGYVPGMNFEISVVGNNATYAIGSYGVSDADLNYWLPIFMWTPNIPNTFNKVRFKFTLTVAPVTTNDIVFEFLLDYFYTHETYIFQQLIDDFGDVTAITPIGSETPGAFALSQNYPNPFNPTTKINFSVPKKSHVTLKVYDVLGRAVATLVNETKNAGNYAVDFNGSTLTSGTYFYRITADGFTEIKKMTLVK